MAASAEKGPREAAEHTGASERRRVPVRPVEAGCGRRSRPSEVAAGKAVEEAADEEMKKATKEDREPSATTGEWQPTERWAEEEERRKEEVKETRRVTKRRRDVEEACAWARMRRAATRRHEAEDGHVRKAGGERRAVRRGREGGGRDETKGEGGGEGGGEGEGKVEAKAR